MVINLTFTQRIKRSSRLQNVKIFYHFSGIQKYVLTYQRLLKFVALSLRTLV